METGYKFLVVFGVRLIPWCLQKGVFIKEKRLNKKSLDSSDVFILDLGLEIYQVSEVFACW